MNCLGLIPVQGTPFGLLPAPTPALLKQIRIKAEEFLPQMHHCGRCRADAVGLLETSRPCTQ